MYKEITNVSSEGVVFGIKCNLDKWEIKGSMKRKVKEGKKEVVRNVPFCYRASTPQSKKAILDIMKNTGAKFRVIALPLI
jgi:hypothetical protein